MDLTIRKINETYIKIDCEESIEKELGSYFTFEVPNSKFKLKKLKEKYKDKKIKWDGKIRLFNMMTHQIYLGLIPYIKTFCEERNYTIQFLDDFDGFDFSLDQANEFIKTLSLPENYTPRDYQLQAFQHAVSNNRTLLLSPTASGKSLMIYLLVRFYSLKTLVIVPTVTLIHQLTSDFSDYGYDEKNIHKIFTGKEKSNDCPVFISTWQSIYKLPKKWFEQFDVVIGDEAHLCQSDSFKTIFSKLTDCKYRFGFTGSLSDSVTHRLVIEGMFGKVKRTTTTSELIKQNYLSKFEIKCLVLDYPDKVKITTKQFDYQTEMDFLCLNQKRNEFIKKLAVSLNGNTLILFQYVEKHGKQLYNMINVFDNRKVFFVHGKVDGEERDSIRKLIENEKDAIIVASYQTFSTGINLKNLHNIICASPSKSRIRMLQSIGRGLRKSDNKEKCVLYDIADNLQYKRRVNFTLKHFAKRIKLYNEENFNYKIFKFDLKVD